MGEGSFDGVVGGGLHDPLEIVFAYAGFFGIGGRVAEIDRIGDAVAYGKLDGIEIIAQPGVDTQDDLLHFLQSFRGGIEIGDIAEVMGIAGFIGHDPYIFAADAIAAIVFCEDDFFLE